MIDSINYAKNISISKKFFNINNRTLVINIIDLVKRKKINLVLVKVRAHMGIWSNERADKLAKEAVSWVDTSVDKDRSVVNNSFINITLGWRDLDKGRTLIINKNLGYSSNILTRSNIK